jgi:hypothetical protein
MIHWRKQAGLVMFHYLQVEAPQLLDHPSRPISFTWHELVRSWRKDWTAWHQSPWCPCCAPPPPRHRQVVDNVFSGVILMIFASKPPNHYISALLFVFEYLPLSWA